VLLGSVWELGPLVGFRLSSICPLLEIL
jgi:hypothetical protein